MRMRDKNINTTFIYSALISININDKFPKNETLSGVQKNAETLLE